jgi:putative transport protein
VIIFCTTIAPVLLRIDLKAEALKLEQALGVTRAKPGLASAWRKFELRAYRLAETSPLVGLDVAAAEARVPDQRDVIALSGPRAVHR